MLEKYEKVLKEDLFLKTLKEENLGSLILTGGAVIDILSGVIPKDYDFVHTNIIENKIKANDKFKLLYTSSTAATYEYLGKDIQLLYKNPLDFPYTIEQSKFNIDTGKLEYFATDSFEQKLLVPNKEVYKSKSIAKNVIRRLLHWQGKGYTIHPVTFASVLKTAFKKCKCSSHNLDEDEDEES
jgi:hypothetical protein